MTPPPLPAQVPTLLREVHAQYQLDWEGLHGASHWARVLENGLRLCALTPGLRQEVVVAFAVLHDACRRDDGHDGGHGPRAAQFAQKLHQKGCLDLDTEGLALLMEACRTHTGGRIPAHPMVMACWDSDRLDLPRIHGVRVRTHWLGTPAARDPELVAWATQRAKAWTFPWREAFLAPVTS